MNSWKVIGLMSGTSLDGVDVAGCTFHPGKDNYTFRIAHATTFRYDDHWSEALSRLHQASAMEYHRVHVDYGHFLGKTVNEFIRRSGFRPDIIASHGHTIFHQPAAGFTAQVGDGSAIAAETGITVVCDFRSADVAMGGQGAPLVPFGDRMLFGEYDACLNLGGFSNLSREEKGQRIAFDICPVNIVLNRLAGQLGEPYDPEGRLAASGSLNDNLLNKLDALPYYKASAPKSLRREWLETAFMPIILEAGLPARDALRTVCEHIARQIDNALGSGMGQSVLVTGGGAWNNFLIERLKVRSARNLVIPEPGLVDYKEALVFALLGLQRYLGQVNVLRSVTGCRLDHSAGALWQPTPLPPRPGVPSALNVPHGFPDR